MIHADRYKIGLRASNGARVTGLRGAAAPKITDGYGGWTVVARPKRVGATVWEGRDPLRATLPMLFDGWATQESVEDECHALERMAGLPGDEQPPTVDIVGYAPHQDLKWVIERLDWGDDVIYGVNRRGNISRLRQDVVVNLLQYVKVAVIKETITRPGMPSSYVTKKGDTIQKIAAKFYGDAARWKDIARENNLRDPSHLKPGTRLRLP